MDERVCYILTDADCDMLLSFAVVAGRYPYNGREHAKEAVVALNQRVKK